MVGKITLKTRKLIKRPELLLFFIWSDNMNLHLKRKFYTFPEENVNKNKTKNYDLSLWS